jgi:transposase
MVDHTVDSSAPRGRVDIRAGVGRRRRWSDEEKGRVVAESYAPGAVVSEVAREHEITPQHLFAWRKAAREGRFAVPADAGPLFVPVVVAPQTTASRLGGAALIIEIDGVVLRADCGIDVGWLANLLCAVKAAR